MAGKWRPEPFKHTAAITVSTWLSDETSVDMTIDDVSVEDAADVSEYCADQLEALAKKRLPPRKARRKKKTPLPSPPESQKVEP